MIRPVSDLIEWKYKKIIKPALFCVSPDALHERALAVAKISAQVPALRTLLELSFAYEDSSLQQKLLGTTFANPVGLAAGYDYKAAMPNIAKSLGLGWQTVGSVTYGAYAGNAPPMYDRLPKTQSLWINKGFKNEGARIITDRLIKTAPEPHLPIGISVGATNKAYETFGEVLQEYEQAFAVAQEYTSASYYELNISCPNLQSKHSLYDAKNLRHLLELVDSLKLTRPLLVKMPVDISDAHLKTLLDLMAEHSVEGFIIGNLTKNRKLPIIWQTESNKLPYNGGLSGKPVQALSDHLIAVARAYSGDRFVIVGCGGVFTGADAYRKIRQGASLIQMITGLIYRGPQAVGQINRELAELLKRDGFTHISQAIGVDVRVQ